MILNDILGKYYQNISTIKTNILDKKLYNYFGVTESVESWKSIKREWKLKKTIIASPITFITFI